MSISVTHKLTLNRQISMPKGYLTPSSQIIYHLFFHFIGIRKMIHLLFKLLSIEKHTLLIFNELLFNSNSEIHKTDKYIRYAHRERNKKSSKPIARISLITATTQKPENGLFIEQPIKNLQTIHQ